MLGVLAGVSQSTADDCAIKRGEEASSRMHACRQANYSESWLDKARACLNNTKAMSAIFNTSCWEMHCSRRLAGLSASHGRF